MQKIVDEEIIKQLQHGEQADLNRIFRYLHKKVYGQVSVFIKKYSGTKDDTADIFQDALLAIYKLARRNALKSDTNIEAYFFTICKNLWFQQLRKRKETYNIDDINYDISIPEVSLFRLLKLEEQKEIQKLINQIGEGCKKILVDFYYKKIRLKEVAERMGYASEQVAKNRKSDCLKKLKKLMLLSPLFQNRFKKTL